MKKFFIKKLYKILLNRIYNPFIINNVKPIELIPNEGDKYLVIAPHPDDESIGCGGIMSVYPDLFDVLCLTHGDENDIRKTEMQNAMNYAGIKNLTMLNIRDKHIIDGQNEFDKFDIGKYDIIFIPYIFDQHKDHKAVSLLLLNKLKHCNYKRTLKIAYYEVWSAINMPLAYVNISNVIENKKNMINCHKSQIASKNYADKITALNSYRGLLRSLDAVECYSIVDVNDFCKLVPKLIYDF